MQRLLSLFFVLALVAVTLSLAPVRPAEAAPPGCACGACSETPQTYGQGDTCDQALADLKAKSIAYVDCSWSPYGRCSLTLIITAGCHWDSFTGKFQYDGRYRYCCWSCVDVE
jgi:hypothetical protein